MVIKILPAIYEESNEGWVWGGDNSIPSRSVVRIKNLQTQKSILCEYRVIDDNFKRKYNNSQLRKKIRDEENIIVMSEWYRNKLGIDKTRDTAELEIKISNNFYSKIRFQLQHPHTVVRVATQMAIVSLLLGIVALILGLLSLF